MNILLVAAEVSPYAKVGGLADMTSALPKAWQADGHSVTVVLPKYGAIDAKAHGLEKTDLTLAVPFGAWNEYASVWKAQLPGSSVPVYLIGSEDYFERPGIYGYHEGYEDNDRRFIFLSKAAFELAKALGMRPDVIHAHDYHTAPCMPLLKVIYRHQPEFAGTRGVFTIHNMAYQGYYDPIRAMDFCGFPMEDFYPGAWYEQDGAFNCLKAGIMFADKVTTVSPTYAQEIRWTPEGMGLQSALQARGADLIGVLNGIDTDEWSPANDPFLALPYDVDSIEKKQVLKSILLAEHGCYPHNVDNDLPLIGMVTRLTEQKGISIFFNAIQAFIERNACRLVVLGSGDRAAESRLRELAAAYPSNVIVHTGYNNALSHQIQAASDFYLMPSKFEPCGLTQMYAMAYGTVPIVRAVGGLADSVTAYDPVTFHGTGFRFSAYTAEACAAAIADALRVYRREPHWTHIRRNAMDTDMSITRAARRYVEVFGWTLEARPR
ncbi:MAG: glycogen synthase [Candidatus Kapabacteria bacterium]|jgi:starch synthase|nr:glycogen synthase [Candidatus Kapabacteria bacterium]